MVAGQIGDWAPVLVMAGSVFGWQRDPALTQSQLVGVQTVMDMQKDFNAALLERVSLYYGSCCNATGKFSLVLTHFYLLKAFGAVSSTDSEIPDGLQTSIYRSVASRYSIQIVYTTHILSSAHILHTMIDLQLSLYFYSLNSRNSRSIKKPNI